jgi:hypothetical protein
MQPLASNNSGTMPSGRAHEVSFDRPYDGDEGAGQQLRYESHLARFLSFRLNPLHRKRYSHSAWR